MLLICVKTGNQIAVIAQPDELAQYICCKNVCRWSSHMVIYSSLFQWSIVIYNYEERFHKIILRLIQYQQHQKCNTVYVIVEEFVQQSFLIKISFLLCKLKRFFVQYMTLPDTDNGAVITDPKIKDNTNKSGQCLWIWKGCPDGNIGSLISWFNMLVH